MKSKIAILGAGRWGTHLIRNFSQHPNAQLVAVVDSYPERLSAIRKKLNLDPDIILTENWESVQKTATIDGVVIATPAKTHYSLIRDALEQGYHVLAEKPLTLNVSECLELSRLAEEKQRQLMVDHTYLFHPVVERGKEVVASGCLGELRYGYAARTNLGPVRQDVDALWDLAIHDIAIFNNWLGEYPIQVEAAGKIWLQKGETETEKSEIESLPSFPLPAKGLADVVYVTLSYPSGFEAWIHLCWLNPDKQRRLGVVGSKGTLIFDEMQNDTPLTIQHGYFEQEGVFFNPVNQRYEVVAVEAGEPLKKVCDRFLANMRSGESSPISSGWVGAGLVQILSCLTQSLQQGGKPIPIPQLNNREKI
ncbi:MAG TPA: oxidoreductase [Cyanobacteria bacterium UBA11149]|nr:oxidoreductase [Cyanobacteria bacterium UBA11367]HBE58593.1 oxidoreductase [Cyanobacteria bacterium UBA11366]HBK65792.1 oxidoreductase [Cyanobacteria bacterium UBA11166]HBR74018.1 oxidoreductase [Cyanobacteria bacterium UBA11159]HBS67842.1 oxidoreductase [Cyanobacteria bacterium UBA11153]HBW90634.1 oxidoreductase [Cyanobacteria bacterium UBA11149]HCA93693.1 oxidoreductase [Cyanobacteria bacterium UBA9226]